MWLTAHAAVQAAVAKLTDKRIMIEAANDLLSKYGMDRVRRSPLRERESDHLVRGSVKTAP